MVDVVPVSPVTDTVSGSSVMEQSQAGVGHGDTVFVTRLNNCHVVGRAGRGGYVLDSTLKQHNNSGSPVLDYKWSAIYCETGHIQCV